MYARTSKQVSQQSSANDMFANERVATEERGLLPIHTSIALEFAEFVAKLRNTDKCWLREIETAMGQSISKTDCYIRLMVYYRKGPPCDKGAL